MPPFKTRPHGEHEIRLIEDAVNSLDRIYVIEQGNQQIGILGSELTSLVNWFEDEKKRIGQDVDE
jgi:hypothetical protein